MRLWIQGGIQTIPNSNGYHTKGCLFVLIPMSSNDQKYIQAHCNDKPYPAAFHVVSSVTPKFTGIFTTEFSKLVRVGQVERLNTHRIRQHRIIHSA